MSDVKLAPSILAADFARLGQQLTEAAQAGADKPGCEVEVDGGIEFGGHLEKRP